MKHRMVLRHIDSGVEHDIDFGQEFKGDDGTAFGRMSRTQCRVWIKAGRMNWELSYTVFHKLR
jgi:hypothetical protein